MLRKMLKHKIVFTIMVVIYILTSLSTIVEDVRLQYETTNDNDEENVNKGSQHQHQISLQ